MYILTATEKKLEQEDCRAEETDQWLKYLSHKHEVLSSNPLSPHKHGHSNTCLQLQHF